MKIIKQKKEKYYSGQNSNIDHGNDGTYIKPCYLNRLIDCPVFTPALDCLFFCNFFHYCPPRISSSVGSSSSSISSGSSWSPYILDSVQSGFSQSKNLWITSICHCPFRMINSRITWEFWSTDCFTCSRAILILRRASELFSTISMILASFSSSRMA